jgi:hypothetical protein
LTYKNARAKKTTVNSNITTSCISGLAVRGLDALATLEEDRPDRNPCRLPGSKLDVKLKVILPDALFEYAKCFLNKA